MCGDDTMQWEWTRKRTAQILRIGPKWILETWLCRPPFKFWPKQKNNAVLWLQACLMDFRLGKTRTLTMQDFFGFMQRERWKLYQRRDRPSIVGNYLSIIDK